MARVHLSANDKLSKEMTYDPLKAANSEFKPNGLWYSINHEWLVRVRKMDAERFTMYKHKFELEVDFNRICILENLRDVLKFHKKYSYKCSHGYSAIRWDKVMSEYSGIEIRNYENLKIESAFRGIIWLRNWEMESGCIWNLQAVNWKII